MLFEGVCVTAVILAPGTDFEWLAIDAYQLYEHIDPDDLLHVVSARIRTYYQSSSSLASLLINLLDIVVRSQFVRHRGRTYLCKSAIATGLPPGVFLANIYLDKFDHSILNHIAVLWYRRLVDDACMLVKTSATLDVTTIANNFHDSITWEISGRGDSVNFLDVTLSFRHDIQFRIPSWTTYRKPLNAYLYVPASSCHPISTLKAIVSSEVARMLNTNKHKSDCLQQLDFFTGKLLKRGYDMHSIVRCIKSALKPGTCKAVKHVGVRNIFLKVQHSSVLNAKFIRNTLGKHTPLLARACGGQIDLILCRMHQYNLFRRGYRNNWSNRTWEAFELGRGGS